MLFLIFWVNCIPIIQLLAAEWRMKGILLCSFQKHNKSQKNINTLYSGYTYSGIVPKRMRPKYALTSVKNNHFLQSTFCTYLLPSRELKLGSPQGFNSRSLVSILGPHRHDDLANLDTCHSALGFTKSTTHTSLEPEIKQHLINECRCVKMALNSGRIYLL